MRVSDLMRDYFNERIEGAHTATLLSEATLPVKTRSGLDWEIANSPTRFRKSFKFKKRSQLLDFVSDVLEYEDNVQHHGRIRIEYKTVIVEVWTHDLGDITGLDKDYARLVNDIYEDSNVNIDE
jgi:pterin-4a-carbinolamine dehydratase